MRHSSLSYSDLRQTCVQRTRTQVVTKIGEKAGKRKTRHSEDAGLVFLCIRAVALIHKKISSQQLLIISSAAQRLNQYRLVLFAFEGALHCGDYQGKIRDEGAVLFYRVILPEGNKIYIFRIEQHSEIFGVCA